MPGFQSMDASIHAAPSSTKRSPRDSSEMTCSTSKDTAGEVSFSCSSRNCKSCTAVVIADSVAVCCCPLAVISLLALAFIKVPYMVGNKCLRLRSRRKRRQTKMMKCWKDHEAEQASGSHRNDDLLICRGQRDHYGHEHDIVFEFREGKVVAVEVEVEEERRSLCGGFEQAERFFMELYQVGQLGFGRVSFSGAQSSHSNKN